MNEPKDIFMTQGTSREGLSSREAARRFTQYGPNEFAERKRLRPLFILLSKFRSPLLILLIAAALISGVLGSHFEAGVILTIVIGSALIDFANTYRSAKAAEALREKVTVTAAILRDGKLQERFVHEIVPGDVIALEAGDIVPADGVVFEAKDLFVDESMLTGESVPVEKEATAGDAQMVFMESSVVSGKGFMVVTTTGSRTRVGGIADKLKKPDAPTEFEKNLKEFSSFIFRVTLFLVLTVILLNIIFNRQDPLQMFLFAIAIAVGLTPELLPLIVTSNLAKGALAMSRGGVIVKKLAAIHNFGSVDVLCTDKTGTLTEDKIALVRCLDPFGAESDETFFWGFMSSKHLTGVRGVLDAAIENYKKINVDDWDKVDEIPFDAVRRIESIVVKKQDKTVLIAKGAPEEILKLADFYGDAKREKMTSAARQKIDAEYESLSKDGFRVLAVGVRDVPLKTTPYGATEEKELSFVGFLAFLDPPKKTVKETLEQMAKINVAIKIVTGDNFLVTKKIMEEIGVPIQGALTGDEIEKLNDAALRLAVDGVTVFSRVTPEQKQRIVRALRDNGHVVAYMGDGVNDVLSLKEADVGISVQNAVDVAKQTADIILLKKGLHEIVVGIVEGRKTFANTFKYLQMALSSNFGNMFSMPVASLIFPFLPMTAPQILLNNFLYDSSQLAIPFDNVDEEFLVRPKKFNIAFLKKFMIIFGPLSSCFDFATFAFLALVLHASGGAFQTGWFLESIATQTLVVNLIRSRSDFWKGKGPSAALFLSTFGAVVIAWLLPYTWLGQRMGFVGLGVYPLLAIAGIVLAYLIAVEFAKKYFYRKYGNLIER
jgi:Mg2+-importing ATPase